MASRRCPMSQTSDDRPFTRRSTSAAPNSSHVRNPKATLAGNKAPSETRPGSTFAVGGRRAAPRRADLPLEHLVPGLEPGRHIVIRVPRGVVNQMSRQYVEDLPDHTAENFCCETAAGSDRLLRRSGSLGFPTPLLRQEERSCRRWNRSVGGQTSICRPQAYVADRRAQCKMASFNCGL